MCKLAADIYTKASDAHTCSSFFEVLQLTDEAQQVRVLLPHCRGYEMQQCHAPV